MSQRNTTKFTTAKSQLPLVSALVSARQVAQIRFVPIQSASIQFAVIVLVLVLLITNGGAG